MSWLRNDHIRGLAVTDSQHKEPLTLRQQYILWLLDRDPEFAAKLLGMKR